ncbi:UNVERIFIED_ORG: hypothetical protein LHK14_17895 [Roseateles sp. XES5]|nr:hypothetical protein [Roseateles sp. XES5]
MTTDANSSIVIWYIYESSARPLAVLSPHAYPVPPFCDPASAVSAEGHNRHGERVKVLAAKVDEGKLFLLPDHERADYDAAVASRRNMGDFVLNPFQMG